LTNESEREIIEKLIDIRKLLVLQLLDAGFQAGVLADLLEMDAGDFSRMFPVKKLLKGRKSAGG
jgi:hypothetical protein